MLDTLKQFATAFFTWLRTAYSEPDGNGSSTRVHISILTLFVVNVGISFAVSVHHKLATMAEFDAFLGAASAFLIAVCGPLYATNKLSDWARNRDNQNSQQQPPQPQ